MLAGNRVVAHGGLQPRRGVNVVKLANYCVYVPKGTRLTVTVGASSPAGQIADPRLRRSRLGGDRPRDALAFHTREADLRMKRAAVLVALVLASAAGAASTADPGESAPSES